MADFLITQFVMYPWLAWALAVTLAFTAGFWLVLGVTGVKVLFDWADYRRQGTRRLAAIRRYQADTGDVMCLSCEGRIEDILARAHADPPEYQHPDEDEDEDGRLWCDVCKAERPQDCICGEPPEDWVERLGLPRWGLENLAEGLRAMGEAGALDDDQLPDDDLSAPVYLRGPAMPPQPVREYLHPAILADIDEAGLSHHETTDGAVDSMFTRAMAREVREKEAGK